VQFLRYGDLLAENSKFFLPPSHLAPSIEVTPFEFTERLSWSLPGSWRWRFCEPSLHHFWLIHPCVRQTDRIAMA